MHRWKRCIHFLLLPPSLLCTASFKESCTNSLGKRSQNISPLQVHAPTSLLLAAARELCSLDCTCGGRSKPVKGIFHDSNSIWHIAPCSTHASRRNICHLSHNTWMLTQWTWRRLWKLPLHWIQFISHFFFLHHGILVFVQIHQRVQMYCGFSTFLNFIYSNF